jgi:4-hydroxy-4-methyl-2-oxoglutarate aldolase
MTVDGVLGQLSTATISDAMDRLGICGQIYGVRHIAGVNHLVGPAFTIHYEPVGPSGGTVGDFIDDVPAGCVMVLATSVPTAGTVWGGLLSSVASRRGVTGTVIDGLCRDTARADALGYPLYARAQWMRTGKDRVYAATMQQPVCIGGVLVTPGDLVLGDADGVVSIPIARVEEVLEAAKRIDHSERAITEAIERGQRLDEARRSNGYHLLQRREK